MSKVTVFQAMWRRVVGGPLGDDSAYAMVRDGWTEEMIGQIAMLTDYAITHRTGASRTGWMAALEPAEERSTIARHLVGAGRSLMKYGPMHQAEMMAWLSVLATQPGDKGIQALVDALVHINPRGNAKHNNPAPPRPVDAWRGALPSHLAPLFYALGTTPEQAARDAELGLADADSILLLMALQENRPIILEFTA